MSFPREGWLEEMRSAHLYRVMADAERGSPRETLFLSLAREAESQAQHWARESGEGAAAVYRPDLRTRLVAALVRRHGPRAMRSVLAAMKVRGLSVYSDPAGADLSGHLPPAAPGSLEFRHRSLGAGGNLRAAVFGVNDGLVSNASLILGVAGAQADSGVVLLSGLAGLLAGAFSMAAGEYVSVRSQREMYEHQIALERSELAAYPEEEAEELALIYAARGVAPEEARRIARAAIADPERGLAVLAREELGLNPDELGSPWGAAGFSFAAFGAGALLPLAPFLAWRGEAALWGTVGITAAALFAVGCAISLFTGRAAVRDGLRMLGIGALAGGVTWLIGRWLGVALA